MLSDEPKGALAGIMVTNGPAVLDDFLKIKTLLTDACPGCVSEINLILMTLGLQIPQEILAAKTTPAQQLKDSLLPKLTTEAMLNPDAAEWVLDAWASALGRHDWPEPPKPAVPEGQAPESASAPSDEPPPPPTPEELEKAEGLIRQANLAKIRGDRVAFEKLLEEASATAPGSSIVQETIGDAYIDRKQVRKARDAYQLAVKIDPKNASAERKFGESVLAIQFALNPSFGTSDDSFASGKGLVLLSAMLPGLGQLVAGDTKKGSILIGGWALSLVAALLVPNGLTGLPRLFGLTLAFGRPVPPANNIVLLPLALTVFFWLWSLGDASGRAKTVHRPKIERPIPPSNENFEL